MIEELRKFANSRNLELIENFENSTSEYSLLEAENFIKSNITTQELRPYQIQSLTSSIRLGRAFLLSPTSSGKSFLLYLFFKHYNSKTLLIVPSLGIMEQLKNEFIGYGLNEDDIHCIYSGQEKITEKKMIISTYQSAYKLKKEWFDVFDLVLCDEAHLCTAKSLIKIMENCEKAKNRFGVSGTLEDSKCDKMILTGLFGRIIEVTTTSKLMNQGYVADLTIKAITLEYPEEICEYVAKFKEQNGSKVPMTYFEERDFLNENEYRNNFFKNLTLSLKGNSLLLFQMISHGKTLYEMIQEQNEESVLIYGDIELEERELLRKKITHETSIPLIGSYGTLSVGIDMPYLNNVIFASAFKAKIKTLQSIGRGLRKNSLKTKTTLFDVGDNLKFKSHQNITYKHFKERLALYEKENFKVKHYKIRLNYKKDAIIHYSNQKHL